MDRKSYKLKVILTITITLFVLDSCKKDPTLPVLSQGSVSNITWTTASYQGKVTGDGRATITLRGICYDLSPDPTTAASTINAGSGTGIFTCELIQLTPGSIYYVRAFATSEAGTAYGEQLMFSTSDIELPTLSTVTPGSITSSSALSGGEITDNGGGEITVRGVCWSTSQLPTINNNKTEDGAGTGSFTSTITGLEPETDYYVRAYATNSAGTSYGNELSFASGKITDVDGNEYSMVEIGTQVWLAENLVTTRLNDGTKMKAEGDIPLVTGNTDWSNLSTPGYCWYNNDKDSYGSYGALYNWYAVNSGKLCPDGFHVASNSDWTSLLQYLVDNGFNYDGSTNTPLSENKVAKALSSSSGWTISANTGAVGNDDYPEKINASGFNAKPTGYRRYDGTFLDRSDIGYWWTSTSYSTDYAYYYVIGYSWDQVDFYEWEKRNGYTVRCVKD